MNQRYLAIAILAWYHLQGTVAYLQGDTSAFTANFQKHVDEAFSQLALAPVQLKNQCSSLPQLSQPGSVVVASETSVVSAAEVQNQCGTGSVCIIEGRTLVMTSSLAIHALVMRNGAKLLWTDSTQKSSHQWLCAGYVAVEAGGTFEMNLQDAAKTGWIYISDNGAIHSALRSRAFGAVGSQTVGSTQPMIRVKGRQITRTWTLLQAPFSSGATSIKLMHNPADMGWNVGDRIAVAPTDDRSQGEAQSFTIGGIGPDNSIVLDRPSKRFHEAKTITGINGVIAFKSAEVINLSRNIIITGSDFMEIPCDPSLNEAYPGFGTSTQGCMCSSFRQTCTMGLHTIHMGGGTSQIENVRVEKCGQRGTYMHDCRGQAFQRKVFDTTYSASLQVLKASTACTSITQKIVLTVFRNNAVEFGVQRGLIVHGTHNSLSDSNVFYNVRGANLYIEDGNEVNNTMAYNVAICPWKFQDEGCTVPGTSNDQSDTSLNQAGIYMESPTNHLLGNRMANHFNGMLLNAKNGRGPVTNLVCDKMTPLGRWKGNVFHSSGRFGTYTLTNNYPVKNTGQSIALNGQTTSCNAFTPAGDDNGLSTTIWDNIDYGNAFVGHYEAGDIQYNYHTSFGNLNLIYWKETKSFADGCSAHISNSYFQAGTMALPDSLGSFIIEHTTLDNVLLEANHHCGIGGTGFLCMPHYVLHNVKWIEAGRKQWVAFKLANEAGNGGIFSLSPEDAAVNDAGGWGPFFLPKSFQSLVSSSYPYLLKTGVCVSSIYLGLADRYDSGILCKVPLRAIKIYAKGASGNLLLQVWKSDNTGGAPLAEQLIPLYTSNTWKQGYKFAVIPGTDYFYRISLNEKDIPSDWIIDFGDRTINNRWGVDDLYIDILGRTCNGVIRSDHDRRFITSDPQSFLKYGKGWGHGACSTFGPQMIMNCQVFDALQGDSSNAPLTAIPLIKPTTAAPIVPTTVTKVPIKSAKVSTAPVSPPASLSSDPCKGFCVGTWPYGCNANLVNKVNYMCGSTGGCYYSTTLEDKGPANFCVFKGPGVIKAATSAPIPPAPTTKAPVPVTPAPVPKPSTAAPVILPPVTKAPAKPVNVTTAPVSPLSSLSSEPCKGICVGTWPYGCNANLVNKVNYMCGSAGGCYYSTTLEDEGPTNFCVFKGPGIL